MLGTSERRTCEVLEVARSTLRYEDSRKNGDEQRLAVIRLAIQYGRYGYRKICDFLEVERQSINHNQVGRIWYEKGLQRPARHRRRKELY